VAEEQDVVEPGVRPRRLVVVGTTPVADALTRTALTLDYEVVRVVDASEERDLESPSAALGFSVAPLESLEGVLKDARGEASAVVASQGHYDEQALETILRCGASYVGLVASRKRGATVKSWLQDAGVPGVDAVRYPAGLDLGARTAPEVALSILAEITQRRPEAVEQQSQGRSRPSASKRRYLQPPPSIRLQHGRDRHGEASRGRGRNRITSVPPTQEHIRHDPAQFLPARR
jgi:xanthine/CO dehydrogenase XdhC/CoxF family maturation factor